MKEDTKTFLKIALSSLFIGVVLIGLGYATGGIQAVQEITTPIQYSESFTKISNIELDTSRYLQIQTDDVDQAKLVYYGGSKFITAIKTNQKEGTLSITDVRPETVITGVVENLGYYLNIAKGSTDYNKIVITLPKDTVLESISGSGFGGLSITNLDVKKLNYGADVVILGSSIAGGRILGPLSAHDSSLKDLKIESYSGSLYIRDSKLEKLTIIQASGSTKISDSSLKNVNYSSGQSLEEIDRKAEKSDSDTHITFVPVTLDNVTLMGDNRFIASQFDIEVSLSEESKKKTSFEIESLSNYISVSDVFQPLEETKDGQKTSISYSPEEPTAKLTIRNKRGSIFIK